MIELGKIITDRQERDAIHIAVAPVIAYHLLYPKADIGFVKPDNRTVGATASKKIGIVDPFLAEPINKGDEFWMFLYPNTIISLRHDWTHPEFDVNADKINTSKEWIKKWAHGYGMSYDHAMKCGKEKDFFLGEVVYDQIPVEFWINYEIITGENIDKDTRENTHFHCAC